MRSSCRASAATAAGSAAGLLARHSRTLLPDSATMARNQSALRSLEVGTPGNYIEGALTEASFRCGKDLFHAMSVGQGNPGSPSLAHGV